MNEQSADTQDPTGRGATSPRVIVVGADGSPESAYALRFARDIARSTDGSLRVVHAESDTDLAALASAGAAVAAETAEEETTVRLRLGIADLLEGFEPWDYTVRGGNASDVIIDFAAEVDADLIIVGHRSHGRLGDFLLGSVASKVVHDAHRSVLVAIPRQESGQQ